MDLSNMTTGLLVLVLALLPGLPGDVAYRTLAGVSWREKDFTHVMRLTAFSALGLVLYAVIADRQGWPAPGYVVPSTFTGGTFAASQIGTLGIAYIGHFVAGALVGLGAAGARHLLARIRAVSASRDTWDHLIHCAAPEHWVIVTLQNGDSYAGILDHADVSTEPEYRDLLIAEPYRYDAGAAMYAPTFNQLLFVRGADVASIAVVYDDVRDKRIVPVGQSPFREIEDERQTAGPAAKTIDVDNAIS